MIRTLLPPFLTAVALALAVWLIHRTGLFAVLADQKALRTSVEEAGWWGPALFVLFLALRPFTLVPSILFAPVAAELFGVFWGATLKIAGETLGATLAFLAARYGLLHLAAALLRVFGRRRPIEEGFVSRLDGLLRRRGFRAVLALRFNLLLPFDWVNYGLGLTPVRLWAYVAGTLIGIAPGTYLYVGLSGSAAKGALWPTVAALVGIALMLWLSVPLFRELSGGASPRRTR